jgi:hypothetical protein
LSFASCRRRATRQSWPILATTWGSAAVCHMQRSSLQGPKFHIRGCVSGDTVYIRCRSKRKANAPTVDKCTVGRLELCDGGSEFSLAGRCEQLYNANGRVVEEVNIQNRTVPFLRARATQELRSIADVSDQIGIDGSRLFHPQRCRTRCSCCIVVRCRP